MQTLDIRLRETAPWHALITRAQVAAQIDLSSEVEAYLMRVIYRYVASPDSGLSHLAEHAGPLMELFADEGEDKADMMVIADQSLIFAGLLPEQAIRRQIPLSYFVEVGRYAYTEIAERTGETVYGDVSRYFVSCVDVLHTAREIDGGHPCIDPISAFELWQNAGSRHAWEYLRRLTPALPGVGTDAEVRH